MGKNKSMETYRSDCFRALVFTIFFKLLPVYLQD